VLDRIRQKDPEQFNVYPDLVRILNDHGGDATAAKLVAYWRSKQPDDFLPAMEEIREDLVAKRISEAEDKSDRFLAARANQVEVDIKAAGLDDEKVKKERRKQVLGAACAAISQAWVQGGQPEGADKWLARWLDQQPNDTDALLLRAQVALARDDWTKAKDIYEAILKDEKYNYVAQDNLAWLLAEHFGKPDEALKMLRPKLKNPFSGKQIGVERLPADFLNILGKVYVQAIRKKVENNLAEEMTKIFDVAGERYPSDPRILFFKGFAHAELSEKDKASDALSHALRLAKEGKGRLTQDQRKELIQRISERMNQI
jgi:tetratricopeptide (TPR) repeat protein